MINALSTIYISNPYSACKALYHILINGMQLVVVVQDQFNPGLVSVRKVESELDVFSGMESITAVHSFLLLLQPTSTTTTCKEITAVACKHVSM